MTERIKRAENKKALIFWFTMIITWVLLLFLKGMGWEANDDPAMAYILYQYGPENTPYANPIYLKAIFGFYNICNKINWWFLTQVLGIVISSFGFLALIYKRSERWQFNFTVFVGIMNVVFVYSFCVLSANFTKSSVFISFFGMTMVCVALNGERVKWRNVFIGAVFIAWGAMIRFEGAILSIPFVLSMTLDSFFTFRKIYLKRIFCTGLVIGLVLLPILVSNLFKNEALLKFESGPSEIDYPYILSADNNKIEKLHSIDLDEADVNYFMSWHGFDRTVFSDEKITVLIDATEKNNNINYFWMLMKGNLRTQFMGVFVAFLGILFVDREALKKCKYPLLLGMVFIVAFSFYGRIIRRLYDSCLFLALQASIMVWVWPILWHDKTPSYCIEGKRNYVIIICTIVISITSICRGGINDSIRQKNIEHVLYPNLTEYMCSSSLLYYVDIWQWLGIVYYKNIMLNEPKKGYGMNVYPISGWVSTLPCIVENQKEQGITNPSLAMTTRDDVLTIENKDLQDFLMRHYGEVEISNEIELDNVKLARYSGTE